MKRFLFWTPRILCLVLAGFISLFALDVFSEGYRLPQLLIAGPLFLVGLLFLIGWRYRSELHARA